ncbi:MAG: protoheme IX farnesyltransferase [Verrucomicrobia bacterium]|nr:protoheme IX farnesyltransferase [Verrucomicrobiota bacterium]
MDTRRDEEGGGPMNALEGIAPVTGLAGMKVWLKDWAELMKARLSLLVLLTTLVGLYCGSGGQLELWRTVFTLLGTSLVAAAAAALNEWIERDLDAKMIRTAQRPLPMGRISPDEALVALNTLVGAVPGAIPPLIGFVAGRGNLGLEGWALFSILFLWQIPHFLAIAWRHREDYRRAGFRMLPCHDEQGRVTGLVALVYCLALLAASIWPVYLQSAGLGYAVGAVVLGGAFAFLAGSFAWKPSLVSARNLFLGSIAYLPILLILLVVDRK